LGGVPRRPVPVEPRREPGLRGRSRRARHAHAHAAGLRLGRAARAAPLARRRRRGWTARARRVRARLRGAAPPGSAAPVIRPIAWLASLVLVLALADAWLAGRETRARDEERRVGALFQPSEAENLRKQPAFRVELAGEQYSYGRVEGQWRCLSYH